MKNKLYLIFAFIITFVGYAQQVIGTYPVHDGGFEGHTATSLVGGNASAAALSTSLWTANTGTNVVRVINSTGGRSGPRSVSLGSTNSTLKNFYSPQLAGAFAPNTTYQIQFYYKSASTTALDASTVDLFVDNTSATQLPPIGTKQSIAAGLSTSIATWTKVSVAITTDATVAGNFGVAGFTIDAATGGYSAEFDDFVVYQANSADTTAPNSPGLITATGAASGGANLSWGAASGGVDGGGYVVVRYAATAPSASDDPNVNGIYKFNNNVGVAGTVRYIGTATSFADTSLSPGIDYYYKVYTVDKAFNYSDESITTTPVQSLATAYYYKGTGLLTELTNWGTNTNGTGIAPASFTDASQVFEIRNTTAVALDGVWTVGTDPANGTKVRLGSNSQAAITLTVNSGASLGPSGTGNIDVLAPTSGNQTVIYKGTTALSFGNIFDDNLAIIYDGVAVSSGSTKNFGTISIINTANVIFTANPITKNIFVDAASTLVAPNNVANYITIPAGGSVVINGTVKVPKLTGFVSSGVTPSSTGASIQFIGSENLVLGANSIVEYIRDAVGPQTVTARTDYKNLILSGTVPKTTNGPIIVSGALTVNQSNATSGLTLSANLTVNGSLSFVLGKINTGSNTLMVGISGSITGATQATGWIVGNLKKLTAASASPSYTYAIGDATNYTPLFLSFSGVSSAAGGLTASINTGDHPQIATSGLDSAKGVNRSWTLTNDALANYGTYNVDFSYASADNDVVATPANYLVKLYNGSAWSAITKSGVSTDVSTTATAIGSFGEFAIGEVDPFLGLNSNEFQSLTVYPNPANDGVLYISSTNGSQKFIEIFDLAGKKVFSSNFNSDQVDVKSLNTGIYFAKIKADNRTAIQKIVIQNN